MGVYINMDMPKKTYAHCMLIKEIDGSVRLHVCTKNSKEISEWEFYDLVHVPEPHGRLINADALVRDNGIKEIPEYYEVVCDAPTIIPASEDDEK